METGVARVNIDLDEYKEKLEDRLGMSRHVMRKFINKAKKSTQTHSLSRRRTRFHFKSLRNYSGRTTGYPVLLGRPEVIEEKLANLHLDISKGIEIIHPPISPNLEKYGDALYDFAETQRRCENGSATTYPQQQLFRNNDVEIGRRRRLGFGPTQQYSDVIRPAFADYRHASRRPESCGIVYDDDQRSDLLFADATVNAEPSAEDLADIAILANSEVRRLGVDPKSPCPRFQTSAAPGIRWLKSPNATKLVRERGLIFSSTGKCRRIPQSFPKLSMKYSRSAICRKRWRQCINFPNLSAGNVALQTVAATRKRRCRGPILMGMEKPVHLSKSVILMKLTWFT